MRRFLIIFSSLWLAMAGIAHAQQLGLRSSAPSVDLYSAAISDSVFDRQTLAGLVAPAALPRMAPDLALQAYAGRTTIQAQELSAYTATTVIRAQLPSTSQFGEFELQRRYSAPRTLIFKALHFTGDNFVKSNIIVRLLQSEVEHVQKDDPAMTSINRANYKFSYKGTSQWAGHDVHVFQVKPRGKRPGLFKGKIYLDAYSGSLVRAEGRLVKSPSFFIKKIEFAQDFADIDSFTFPVHIHTEAETRVLGRAIVDIYDQDYRPVAGTNPAIAAGPAL